MAKDKNQLRANGHINIPNVNSTNECIGLTYTIRGVKNLTHVAEITKKLDSKHDLESFTNVEITHYKDTEESLIMKYKIKACGEDDVARKTKAKLDKTLKTLGGQTILDAPVEDEDE